MELSFIGDSIVEILDWPLKPGEGGWVTVHNATQSPSPFPSPWRDAFNNIILTIHCDRSRNYLGSSNVNFPPLIFVTENIECALFSLKL